MIVNENGWDTHKAPKEEVKVDKKVVQDTSPKKEVTRIKTTVNVKAE
jgi:hypothetical protein